MNNVDTSYLSVTDLALGYRTGRFTPLNVVEQALDRLLRLEPQLNAFANPMADVVRAQAIQATNELVAGIDLGPLHGIPVAIKDLIEVAGMPTGYGTRVHEPRMADHDALLVARLRAAGAVIFGKTNLLEYAYGIAHPAVGQTNNPHNSSRTAGGSSGGSAAAVAAGIVPLAIGTDTGGSIRIPAAYCGIVGLKPTYGLVPLDGVFPLSHSLDHVGLLARNAEDVASLLACLAGSLVPLVACPNPLRIGIVAGHFSQTSRGHAVTKLVRSCLASLLVTVTEVDCLGLEQANTHLLTILAPEAALVHKDNLGQNATGYAPGTRSQIEAGFAVAATDYLVARHFQADLRGRVEALFDRVDVLAAPSVPFIAPHEDPLISEGQDSEMLSSGFANLTGQPSISLPCGQIDGLPVGLQLTAALGQDARLLSIVRNVAERLASR